MTTPRINKWRYACIGASTEDTTKAAILGRTAGYDDECVLFVGQGLIAYDSSGNRIEYPPSKATQAVAGKRSHLKYNEPMFGGEDKKLLSYNGTGFFVDIMPMIDETVTTTDDDYDEYNEKGVITFIKEIDGVRIKEGVTTVQPSNTNMQSMESVVNIVFEACRIMTKKSREMFGRGISNTFKTDLEQHVGQGLEEMKSTDYSLIDLPDEQLQAYTVEAVVTPRSRQRRGEVLLSASIVPVYAARQIDITLTVL